MENLPQKQQNQFLENLNAEQVKVAQELEQLNEIYAPFKLSDDDLARWAVRITTTYKDVTPKKVEDVVLNFITGKYQWNKNLGVANIFHGLFRLESNNMVY